ncbi:MAG: 30S ribosomal protein S4e [Nanoarchaeota archaeon]|jgi:small subunit ribosomal protein S4e|nr:30S ribosomal protein S4e [Nanoarchaeota archaeon]|tara:strand:- start:26105 stop:26803 length:699 start_codon:yes stop_codon:yes gene_type:complete
MPKRHLKLLAAPKSWPVKRKSTVWITRPNPGAHKLVESLSISLVLKLLKATKTAKETREVINQRAVLVNNKPVKSSKFPVGLFDVVSLQNKDFYRLTYNSRGRFTLVKVPKGEENIFPHKILNKTLLKNKKIQLNFHNGFNLLIDENKYNTNDVLVLDKDKVKDHISFEKGALVYIAKGKHLGEIAKINTIHEKTPLNKHVLLELNDQKVDIPKSYVFVIGKTKPILNLKNE